jgi:hypothetical protein
LRVQRLQARQAGDQQSLGTPFEKSRRRRCAALSEP